MVLRVGPFTLPLNEAIGVGAHGCRRLSGAEKARGQIQRLGYGGVVRSLGLPFV